jgi:hypothetical protein
MNILNITALKESLIVNEHELERYLKAEEKKENLQNLLGAISSSPSHHINVSEDSSQSSTSIPLQAYRPGYR